ncbi:MAG: hypothetical protein DMG11_34280 [Acidobacteria bacterium]|nr:MAG: hypothetical protein DMG11_34280 [Acidobacteriota bacterium]
MKFWNHLLASLVLTMLPAPLPACFCGNSLRFCQALPETGNADHVVFVGKVTQIYPKSWADMMEEFARTHRDLLESLRAQSADTSGRRLAGSPSADLTEWRKQIIEYFWGDTLTPTARSNCEPRTNGSWTAWGSISTTGSIWKLWKISPERRQENSLCILRSTATSLLLMYSTIMEALSCTSN